MYLPIHLTVLFLFVIFTAAKNGKSTVNLFQQHNACQLVRECHFGHRHFIVGKLFYSVGQAMAGTDDKADVGKTFHRLVTEQLCKFLAGHLPAFDAHGDNIALFWNVFYNFIRFSVQSFLYHTVAQILFHKLNIFHFLVLRYIHLF